MTLQTPTFQLMLYFMSSDGRPLHGRWLCSPHLQTSMRHRTCRCGHTRSRSRRAQCLMRTRPSPDLRRSISLHLRRRTTRFSNRVYPLDTRCSRSETDCSTVLSVYWGDKDGEKCKTNGATGFTVCDFGAVWACLLVWGERSYGGRARSL
jgi:hypothetical protein